MEKLLDLGLECELLSFSCGCHRRHSHGRRSARQKRSGGDQVLSIRCILSSNLRTTLTPECKSISSSNLQLFSGASKNPKQSLLARA
jgi:hypothetical protein